MRHLSPEARKQLVQRVFACSSREELHALERDIATHYAATPALRAANNEQLEWLRNAARARRAILERDRTTV